VREYGVEYRLDRLEEVAGKTRTMPDAFIAGSGADVTDAFVSYLRPLLGSDMPGTARLRAPAVAKVLAS
jgi:6-phosphofructokinase 1